MSGEGVEGVEGWEVRGNYVMYVRPPVQWNLLKINTQNLGLIQHLHNVTFSLV